MARVGISGWRYAGWRGQFYPPGLPQRRELEHVAERLGTVEVNGSFYSLQRPSSWQSWRDQVPPDFVFAVKGPRYITHMKKLVDVEAPLGTFLASGVLSLGERLGPLLWQLPPNLRFDPDRLSAFLDLLPRSTRQASSYAAAHHDASKLKEPADTTAPVELPLRHVVEARHEAGGRVEVRIEDQHLAVQMLRFVRNLVGGDRHIICARQQQHGTERKRTAENAHIHND